MGDELKNALLSYLPLGNLGLPSPMLKTPEEMDGGGDLSWMHQLPPQVKAKLGLPAQIATPDTQQAPGIPSLPDQSVTGANLGADAPAPPPQGPPPGLADAQLAAAQGRADQNRILSHAGAVMNDATNRMLSGWGIAPQGNETFARGEAAADQPVKNLLAQREAARQALADKAQRDLNDKNSDVSKKAQQLGIAYGIPGALDMTGADMLKLQPLIDRGMSGQEAKAKLDQARTEAQAQRDAEAARTSAEIKARASEGSATRANEMAMLGKRMEQERAMHLEDIQAKNAEKAAANQGKPVPEQEASKIVNQGAALPSIDKLEELQKNVGPTGYIPFINVGAQGRYHDALENLKSSIAAGAAPMARENEGLMRSFEKGLPQGFHGADRAHAAFDLLRQAVNTNRDNQISALKAGGYSPEQIAELQRQGEQTARSAAGGGAGAAGLQPGEVRMLDPQGKPHAVSEKEAAEAESHGWKRG